MYRNPIRFIFINRVYEILYSKTNVQFLVSNKCQDEIALNGFPLTILTKRCLMSCVQENFKRFNVGQNKIFVEVLIDPDKNKYF